MAERSKETAAHVLRLLRVALRERIGVEQLRFRLGRAHVFEEEKAFGWRQGAEAAYDLGLSDELIQVASEKPLAELPARPRNDVEKKADLALHWMERAWFVGDPVVALLFLFFALEALLGVESERLKGQGLAFRQALLNNAVTGSFVHPSKSLFLYEDIRSAAVHGELVPDVSDAEARGFRNDVARTLDYYLTYTRSKGITRRKRLLESLDNHADRPDLIAFLQEEGETRWADFLAKVDSGDL
jgi:hypothetical protein